MATAKAKTTYTAAEVAALEDKIQQQQDEIDALKKKLEHMNEVFANAQRAQYGQSSEKKTYVLNEDQLNFFNEAEDCQDHKAEEPTEETLTVKAHARKKKRTIDELAKNLPVEEIVIDLPESRLSCDKCGGTFKLIGKKLIRRELIIIPQSEKILEYYSCTYACDKCEKDTGFAHIITTKTPPPLMKHSLASLYCGRCYDEEVCGWSSSCPTGEDLGKTGRGTEQSYPRQLGDPVYSELAEASVQAHEATASYSACHSCG